MLNEFRRLDLYINAYVMNARMCVYISMHKTIKILQRRTWILWEVCSGRLGRRRERGRW